MKSQADKGALFSRGDSCERETERKRKRKKVRERVGARKGGERDAKVKGK